MRMSFLSLQTLSVLVIVAVPLCLFFCSCSAEWDAVVYDYDQAWYMVMFLETSGLGVRVFSEMGL